MFTLAKYNNIKNVNNIKVGKELIIPKRSEKIKKIKSKKWDSDFKKKQIENKKNKILKNKKTQKFIGPLKGKLF